METRRRTVLDAGMTGVADLVMGRFFAPAVLEANGPAVASARRTLLATDPVGYAGCCAAIRDMDHRPILERVDVPALVVSGDLDVGMPWDDHGALLDGVDSRREGGAPAGGPPVEPRAAAGRSRARCSTS